ncbi:MAG: hypothetical protein KDJ19_00860 [Hyphomicrobiaceae bacterium]|nr:hypothetical protein [Hyphomicrobiaceae bacterium]MCC0023200.1 hypothetical protein [Hyphomicrobiaceae bacterium]
MDDDLSEEELALIRGNVRGYQDYWAWRNKPIAETGAVEEVLEALEGRVCEVTHMGKDDPPDCWFEKDGTKISVEHTELVCQEALEETLKTGIHCYKVWDESDLIQELGERIRKKAEKLAKYSDKYVENWLLVVTDEFELNEPRVSDWLSANSLDLCGFTKVIFALSYHPSEDGNCRIPVFLIQGS